jgi:Ca2+-transporting ATPase
MTPYYQYTSEEVLLALKTKREGLSDVAAKKLLKQYGRNVIEVEEKGKYWKMFVASINDVLTWLLFGAAVVAFIMGDNLTGIIFGVIILLNVFLNFFQSYKAENIMQSLKSYICETAKVQRKNEVLEIPVEELVPGDIVLLEEGDAVPADVRILEENGLQVNSFAITGESNPQNKSAAPIHREVSMADQTNMIFMGASIATGNGVGVIVRTGVDTVFGKIAKMSSQIQRDKTPLQKELNQMAKKNVYIALVILTLVHLLCIFVLDYGWETALIFSIVVATSMVPQGLPMEINISLLLGVKRLGKKNVLVKKLSAVEALGSTSIICTDKTGTLTKNEMNVERVFGKNFELRISGQGYKPTGTLTEAGKVLTASRRKIFDDFFYSLHFNNRAHLHKEGKRYSIIGDPTEGSLKVLGQRAKVSEGVFARQYKFVTEIPFDSNRKMMSTLFHNSNKKVTVFTKGSPVEVLANSSHIWDAKTGTVIKLTAKERDAMIEEVKSHAKKAYRVLGIAIREISTAKEYSQESVETQLTFLGCVAMMDPPRRGVKQAFDVARKAGIKTVVITGDSHLTATAIAERVGLLNDQNREQVLAMEGVDMVSLSDTELIDQIQASDAAIFSRVSPEQKLRIVRGLQRRGEIVAVTGDGVNDAPAIKQANVGVAMGKIGTSVAKDVAQIVLTDDSYSTLVYAIKEGRTIYQNLVKTVKSCYTSNFAELTLVLLGIILATKFGGITPLLPVQILLIDLVGETVPLIALTLDPLRRGAMNLPPRKSKDHVLNTRSIFDIIVTGVVMGLAGFFAFAYSYRTTGSAMVATTVTYLMIVLSQYINILNRRDISSTFSSYLWKNKPLWLSFGATLAFLSIFIYTPFAQHPKIGFIGIGWEMWGMMGIVCVALVGILEIKKMLFRERVKV